jgi:hypothetical protein
MTDRVGELPPGVAYMPNPWQPLNVLNASISARYGWQLGLNIDYFVRVSASGTTGPAAGRRVVRPALALGAGPNRPALAARPARLCGVRSISRST